MNNRFYRVLIYIILLLAVSDLSAQESRNFSWLHPKPQGQSIRNIFTLDAHKWYGVTLAGDFIRTTDGGITWKITENISGVDQTSGNSNSLIDLQMLDNKTGIVCGEKGILLKTTDNGLTWTSSYNPDRANTWYDLFFLDQNTGFVCGQSGNGIQITTDAGESWNTINTPATDALSLYAINEAVLYFTTTDGKVYVTENGGTNWKYFYTGSNDTLWKINFLDKGTAIVCGTNNTVKVTTDQGVTWQPFSQELPSNTWYDIDFQEDKTFLPVSESFAEETFPPKKWNSITFSGSTAWERSTVSPYLSPACVWSNYDASGGDNVLMTPPIEIIGGDKLVFYMRRSYTGTIFNWDSLQVLAVPTGGNVNRESTLLMKLGLNRADTSASTYPPRIGSYKKFEVSLDKLTSKNVRLVFRHKNQDGTGVRLDEMLAGSYRSKAVMRVYLTGNQSNVYRNIISPLVHLQQPWTALPFINPSQIYQGTMLSTSVIGEDSLVISGINGSINRSYPFYGNEAYSDRTTGNDLYDIWSDSEGKKIISVGSAGIVLTSSDYGQSWNYNKINDSSLYSISMVDQKVGWVAGSDGYLYNTIDGGATWNANVSYRAINLVFDDFYEVSFLNRKIGWAFDANANIINTTNGGKVWLKQNADLLQNTKIFDSFIQDQNTVIFVGSNGTIGKTIDGGSNWSTVNYPTRNDLQSIYMLDGSTGWICGEKGTLLKTIDAGDTWAQVTIPYPTTNLHCIRFIDKNNGMIVGSDGKTFRTTDGGISWIFENSGATDHYALDMLSTKTAYISSSLGNIIKYNGKTETRPDNISENNTPYEITLYQNYPNPFNPSTVIKFALPEKSIVSLKVYDISGRVVVSLINNESFNTGTYSRTFNASNLSSGIYLYSLIINGKVSFTHKMLFLK